MTKSERVAQLLRVRIESGDYRLADIPVERVLAEETGVSRLTARKSIQMLIDEGLLKRLKTGKVVCSEERAGEKVRQVAFLSPAFSSWNYDWWRFAIERCASHYGVSVRSVDYLHWDDPVVIRTLNRFSGVFLWPYMGKIPEAALESIRATEVPVTLLESNGSSLGIPSIQMFPPESIQNLLDHLSEKGHTHIDVLSTQNFDPTVEARIQQWLLWRSMRGTEGEFHNYPVKPSDSTVEGGYKAVRRLIKEGKLNATALLCTTEPAAIGAMRAMKDFGVEPGKDIAVCAANDEGLCRYLTPSLTALEHPDPTSYLNVVLEWILRGGKGWIGPMNLSPRSYHLFEGESTDLSEVKNCVTAKK